ncbi:MAG: hypothetical protein LC620_02150 [Halobacteriales archaeon]|nr:hypothetical protein [Halobacteriales archaeon]
MTATIAIPEALRDRLRTFGHAGMTYPEILAALMDRVQREEFVADLRRIHAATPRAAYIDMDDL